MQETSFEQKIQKAKEIIEKLSDSSLPLDKGMEYFKNGIKELKEASKLLENAKIEFETIENEFLGQKDD
jgi:exodeoxyribonuclease VII small subunit